jgi:hypothetical protein
MVMTLQDVPAEYREYVAKLLEPVPAGACESRWDEEHKDSKLTGIYMTDEQAWDEPVTCPRCISPGGRQGSVDHVFTWLCTDCLKDRFQFEGDSL